MLGENTQALGTREDFVDKIIFTLSLEAPAEVSPKMMGGEKYNAMYNSSRWAKDSGCLRN